MAEKGSSKDSGAEEGAEKANGSVAESGPPSPVPARGSEAAQSALMKEAQASTKDLEQQHQREAASQLESISAEFTQVKERLFAETVRGVRTELEQLKSGEHEEFLARMKSSLLRKEERQWAAQKWRDFQMKNVEHMCNAEVLSAEEEYEAGRRSLQAKMQAALEERLRKLEEEKTLMCLDDGLISDSRVITRTLRKRGQREGAIPAAEKPSNYRRKLNPPHLSLTLKEAEITEDISKMQKA
mmetsp:Transcript_43833/g.110521  ORF Transcript_43833/g.110521 Transcript_43833/m.110521 type:complete len:242 (+) Transcript_43833:94-819(+)|eukprot:CAMPEP_0177639192 /NCGR_PEP_ID=MMETSP0447-20121125/5891_1 /TAXON_ID=0 /ORGANISM="Stygamoeba regulata, Strain BSH-02190019" /LENGTH=241 /DNA_ID=CAMNT_0019141205 /DNA_START=61 /DNA_END=786 /DNA_ORIENTATION=+